MCLSDQNHKTRAISAVVCVNAAFNGKWKLAYLVRVGKMDEYKTKLCKLPEN